MNLGPTLDFGAMLGPNMIEIAPDGTVAWQLDLTGTVAEIKAAGDRIYVSCTWIAR